MSNPVISALRRAVEASPNDVALRLHLANLELADGQREAAIANLSAVLALEPANPEAAAAMVRALSTAAALPPDTSPLPEPSSTDLPAESFDWDAAEDDLDIHLGPAFVENGPPAGEENRLYSSELPGVTLADVGGMDQVKERLNAAFLAPLQNPELRAMYGKSLRGGLLMYGPPGCGKTYIARAIAGELGARFLPLGVADVLEKWIGSSERNIHEFFQQARRDAPCVVFLDELDTLGQRRSTSNTAMVSVVNQLLTELDGVEHSNEGVFVLAATNQPWQVDTALRRPGRFDRTVLVLPPDAPAREAIFRHHLKSRPVENIDLRSLAGASEGYSGADIAYICESAAEAALMDSVRSGRVRMIQMADLRAAMRGIRPSIGQWLETARNVVMFGEDDGTFAELRAYLKKAKRW